MWNKNKMANVRLFKNTKSNGTIYLTSFELNGTFLIAELFAFYIFGKIKTLPLHSHNM